MINLTPDGNAALLVIMSAWARNCSEIIDVWRSPGWLFWWLSRRWLWVRAGGFEADFWPFGRGLGWKWCCFGVFRWGLRVISGGSSLVAWACAMWVFLTLVWGCFVLVFGDFSGWFSVGFVVFKSWFRWWFCKVVRGGFGFLVLVSFNGDFWLFWGWLVWEAFGGGEVVFLLVVEAWFRVLFSGWYGLFWCFFRGLYLGSLEWGLSISYGCQRGLQRRWWWVHFRWFSLVACWRKWRRRGLVR